MPGAWEGRRKQVPRIGQGTYAQGTHAQETRDQACLIPAQDPRSQVEAGPQVARQMSYRQPAHRHLGEKGPHTTTYS